MRKRKKKVAYSRLVKNKSTKTITRVHKETYIEKKIRLLLQSCGIFFLQEFHLKNKYYDFLIYDHIDSDVQIPVALIEVNGDYFHAFEYVVEKTKQFTKLNKIQKKNIYNDRRKKLLAEEHGIPIHYIWEHDINKNMSVVKQELMYFIESIYGKIPKIENYP